MNLQPMQPSPLNARGETFKVICCLCGKSVKSTDVDCDMDGPFGSYYCQHCAVCAQLDDNKEQST